MRCGIDIINVNCIYKMLRKHRWNFLNSYYSKNELIEMKKRKKFNRKLEYLAGRFAGKEAIYKATQINFDPREVSILNDCDGKPYIRFDTHELPKHCISISHYKGMVVAFVVIENNEI